MNDSQPPFEASPVSAHPAPPSGWKPVSALAVVSFVLSLVLMLVALVGVWISELLPLALGIFTLATVKAGEKRGRLLAIWAVVIAVSAGSCAFMVHQSGRSTFRGIGESMLTALSAKTGAEEQDKALQAWAWSEALEADPQLLEHWRERYAAVVEDYGPWTGTIELTNVLLGFSPLMKPPEGIEEIGSGEGRPGWSLGSVIWLRPIFERGGVHMALVMHAGDEVGRQAAEKLDPGGQNPVRMFGDLRFFREK